MEKDKIDILTDTIRIFDILMNIYPNCATFQNSRKLMIEFIIIFENVIPNIDEPPAIQKRLQLRIVRIM